MAMVLVALSKRGCQPKSTKIMANFKSQAYSNFEQQKLVSIFRDHAAFKFYIGNCDMFCKKLFMQCWVAFAALFSGRSTYGF